MSNWSSRSSCHAALAAIVGVALLAHSFGPAYAQAPPPDPDDFTYVTLNEAGVGRVAVMHNNAVLTTILVGGRPTGVAVAPDGSRLYVANAGTSTVSIINTSLIVPSITDDNVSSVIGWVTVGANPEDLAFTPDGTQVFVANAFGGVRFSVIDTALAETSPATAVTLISTNTINGSRFGIATADVDGTILVFANFADSRGDSVVAMAPNGSFLTSFPIGGTASQDVAASVDGSRVYVASGSGTVAVIDTALVLDRIIDSSTNPVLAQITVPGGPLGLAVSNDGNTVYVTRNLADSVGIIDTTNIGGPGNPLVGAIAVEDGPFGVAFSADGSLAMVANKAGNSATVIQGGAPLTIPFNTLGFGQTQPRWVGSLPGQAPVDTPPDFSLPLCGDPIPATRGVELAVPVSVTDDHGALVVMTASPVGGILDPAFPTVLGSPVTSTFRWTPAASDPAGDYALTFTADDTVNPVVSCSVNLTLPEPPGNTPSGSVVPVQPVDETTSTTPVSLTFASVDVGGDTTLVISPAGPPLPTGFALGTPPVFFDVSTTAVYSGNVSVCIDYSGMTFTDETTLTLQHFDGTGGFDATTSHDTAGDVICGIVTSLSSFIVAEAEAGPDRGGTEFTAFGLRMAKISKLGHFADSFWFNGTFNVDLENGDDIVPVEDAVTIKIEDAEWSIPADAFRSQLRGRMFRYRGTIDGTRLLVYITRIGHPGTGRYNINVSGWKADLGNADNPLQMCVTIGDHFGCAEKWGNIIR